MNGNNYKKQFLSTEEYEEAKGYWFEKLHDDWSDIHINHDYVNTSNQEQATYRILFKQEIVEKLKKISKNQDGSMYVILLATLKVLLFKYTGQTDVMVCSPIYNYEEDTNNYNKYILLRDILNDEMTFKELIMQESQTVSNGYKYQYYPMDRLFKLLGLSTENSAALSVAMTLTSIHEEEAIRWISDSKENDFTFSLIKKGDELEWKILYKSNRFKEETMQQFSERYMYILSQILENTSKKLCDIDLMLTEEKVKIINEFKSSNYSMSCDKTIYEMFEEQVKSTPEEVAIILDKQKITYQELNWRANSLAKNLRENGVKRESIVGIMIDSSIEMIVAILGILKSGGAYLPIDPQYPNERIDYMIKDSSVAIVLTKRELSEKLNFSGKILLMEDEFQQGNEVQNLEKVNKANDLAYVIYTSGSTGMPKGVMVEHHSISNTIQWRKENYSLDNTDVVLQLFSYSFDGFLTSFFTPLVSGCKIVLLNRDEVRDSSAIRKYIVEEKVTHFIIVPSLYKMILQSMEPVDLESVKIITLAGEKASRSLLRESKSKNPKIEIVNEYGPTENTVVTTVLRNIDEECSDIIGKPIANVSVFILGEKNQVQPVGVPGELCISGKGLSRGYLNISELTNEKFVENSLLNGERMYRTGDLACWLPDGNIRFLGRIDNQVKIRGIRLETGEIENALLSEKKIKEAVVVARNDSDGGKYLCAYIISDEEISISNLREYLSSKLPEYMIPAYFINMKSFPVTSNGKIDSKNLPEPSENINTNVKYVAPRTKIEENLVNIWMEVLKVKKVGINDDFLLLGGDSLKSILVINKINSEFGTNFSSKILFEWKNIRTISENLQKDFINALQDGECTIFNEKESKALIFFPPISGLGISYEELSKSLQEYKMYCYDFIEKQTYVDEYIEKISKLPENKKYIFVGYSAGGNLAFEIASKMEKLGYNISDIILIDSVLPGNERVDDIINEEKIVIDMQTKWIMDNMPDQFEQLNQSVIRKTKAYFNYCKNLKSLDQVSINIHFIVSSDKEEINVSTEFERYENAESWRNMTTKKFAIYEGVGRHSVLLDKGYADKNAMIIEGIVKTI